MAEVNSAHLERAMQDSERVLRETQQVAALGSYVLDVRSGAWTSSAQLDEIFGIGPDFTRDIPGWLSLVAPEHRELMAAYFQRLLADRSLFDKDYQVLRPDGTRLWVYGRGRLEVDENNVVVRMVGTIQDIRQRKESEEHLRASEERLQLVLEGSQLGLWDWDLTTGVVNRNARWAQMLGFTMAELEASVLQWSDRVHPDDREAAWKSINDHLAGLTPLHEMEYRLKSKAGDYLWIMDRAKVVSRDTHGKPLRMCGTHADVTAQRNAQEERRRLDAQQQQTQKLESLGLVAGGIAHDFNNLLAAVLTNVSLAKDGTAEDHTRNDLAVAELAIARAVDLTRQLLTFAKGGAPARKVTDIAPMIRQAASFCLRGSNVEARFDVGPLWNVNADEGQLSQVIQNLAINARQAMPQGGVLAVSAHNVERDGARWVRVALTDGGAGIPEAHLQRIFDPYFTTKQAGSGLGLAVARSIIQRHGGQLRVESKLGVGSTFILELPADGRETDHASTHVRQERPRAARILIMDDQDMLLHALSRLLTADGHQVTISHHGQEAVDHYRHALEAARPFHAVLLDLTVGGGMGGAEAARLIRGMDAGAVLVVVSGYSDDPVMANHQDHGFVACLAKPYRREQLQDVLAQVLAGAASAPPDDEGFATC